MMITVAPVGLFNRPPSTIKPVPFGQQGNKRPLTDYSTEELLGMQDTGKDPKVPNSFYETGRLVVSDFMRTNFAVATLNNKEGSRLG